jgi:antitoxin component of RelBE/YafQ-DinJ toxin-antitoxin module
MFSLHTIGVIAMASGAMQSLSVRVPATEKALFAKIARRNGTDPAAAIRTFVHAYNLEGGYPFDTTRYYPLDNEEEAEIAALKEQFATGEIKGFATHAELRASIGA